MDGNIVTSTPLDGTLVIDIAPTRRRRISSKAAMNYRILRSSGIPNSNGI
jgi:hypothetical protein